MVVTILRKELKKGKTIVYLVRHGDREFIPGAKLPGKPVPDSGLSKLGKKQARTVAKKFGKIKGDIDILISSNLNRALETAQEIGKAIKKKPKVCGELAEFNQILWKGKYYHYKYWKHYLKHKISMKAFDKILEENKGKVVVIVAHGNVIKGLLLRKLGVPFKKIRHFEYNNCYVSLARFGGSRLEHLYYFNSKEV